MDIVKQNGRRHTEQFDSKKLFQSIVGACLSARAPIGQAESIARSVVRNVEGWIETHPEVTSQDIRRVAARYLKTHHPDAAYMYEHNKIVI